MQAPVIYQCGSVGCMFKAPFSVEPQDQTVHTWLLIATQLAHLVHAYGL